VSADGHDGIRGHWAQYLHTERRWPAARSGGAGQVGVPFEYLVFLHVHYGKDAIDATTRAL